MAVNVSNSDAVLGNVANPTTLLNATPPNQITITKASVFNTDSGSRTVSIYRVPSGGNTSSVNPITGNVALGALETVVLPLSGQTLVNGQTLQGTCDATGKVQISIGYAQTP